MDVNKIRTFQQVRLLRPRVTPAQADTKLDIGGALCLDDDFEPHLDQFIRRLRATILVREAIPAYGQGST